MKDIIKNNIIIAKFIGGKLKDESMWYFPEPFRYTCAEESRLAFNDSWDWLMPVVDKIEKTHCVNILSKPKSFICMIRSLDVEGSLNISYYKGSVGNKDTAKTKIDAVYNAVVEFIEWYNENK